MTRRPIANRTRLLVDQSFLGQTNLRSSVTIVIVLTLGFPPAPDPAFAPPAAAPDGPSALPFVLTRSGSSSALVDPETVPAVAFLAPSFDASFEDASTVEMVLETKMRVHGKMAVGGRGAHDDELIGRSEYRQEGVDRAPASPERVALGVIHVILGSISGKLGTPAGDGKLG